MNPLEPERHKVWTALLTLVGARKRIRVSGNSMKPAFEDGDEVFVDTLSYKLAHPQIGDIVLSAHPFRRDVQIIKQVHKIDSDGKIYLSGLNALESTDSRSFGAVARKYIKGKVVSLATGR